MSESERVAFFSNDLTYAREADLTLNAPINEAGVIQVGLPKEVMLDTPKTELQIQGDTDVRSVSLKRTDGKLLEVEWVHIDDIAGTRTRLSMFHEPIEEVVFEQGSMKKTPKGWFREWFADGLVSGELAVELAQAVGTTCLKKKL